MFLAPRSRFYIAKTVNFAVWAFPSIFLHDFILFGIDMHQNRSISLFKTLFDHFHFYPLVALKCYPHLISCHIRTLITFLSDPGVLGSDLCVRMWVSKSKSKRRCANLTDVTLADQATNSIQANNAIMAIQGNVAMRVTQPSVQLGN